MTIEVTEAMLAQLGAFMVSKMESANLYESRSLASLSQAALSAQLGMTEALTILGIPVRKAQREPYGQYTYVEIGGKSFSVQTYETD